ncbi:MAG TPA: hypothetical protein VFQ88_07610 [Nevskiaceae bacterium]|nr:hypothetical protein [Nevskiaceae bacterium]
MSKFTVEYSLGYDHRVMIGVEAESTEEARSKAEAAFSAGTTWDNTPDMPLLYDDYDEMDSNCLEFVAQPVAAFPPRDCSVDDLQGRSRAVVAARALVEAYERGKANGGSVEWEDLDAAYLLALEALRFLGVRPKAGDETEAPTAAAG